MFDFTFRTVLGAAGLAQRRLSIVLFHRVLSAPDPLLASEPDSARFAEQVGWLSANFNILTVREAAERLFAGTLPRRALCITFDDGYRDNADNALPVLQRCGVPATFFVTTHYMDGGMMWNDRVIEAIRAWPEPELDLGTGAGGRMMLPAERGAAVDPALAGLKYQPFAERERLASALLERSGASERRLMMNPAEIRRLADAGMEIGGHTESHPILCAIDDAEAHRQIAANKSTLEDILGEPIVTFAYPNGRPHRDYDARHVAMLRECGYRYALTTAPGTARSDSDPLQIPRYTPWNRTKGKYLVRMLQNYFRDAECA